MAQTSKTLQVGITEFSKFQTRNFVYVDKTDLIGVLATQYSDQVLLTRPRRFGKTLLTNTLRTLFQEGVKQFKGLKIEKLWHEQTYDVVQLDFSKSPSSFKTIEEFRERFWNYIQSQFSSIGYQYDPHSITHPENQFDVWLQSRKSQPLVILIDEYDAPLTQCLDDVELFSYVRDEFRVFFNILKSNEGSFRFLFLTGVTRFTSTGIFSGFNSLVDVTLEPQFGTLLGFTEDELTQHFGEHLQKASNTLGMSVEKLIGEMKKYYDGFCFDSQASSHVFCPWSVMRFLMSPQNGFENYWYETAGQPRFLLKHLLNRNMPDWINLENTILVTGQDLRSAIDFDEDSFTKTNARAINEITLFQQAGYLTIKSIDAFGRLSLGYPNQEVRASMARLSAQILTNNPQFDAIDIIEAMATKNVHGVIKCFNDVVNAFDYHRFIITDESSFRSCFQMLLYSLSLRPEIEVHYARGRSDLEVEVCNCRWVFEYKYSVDGQNLHQLLEEAKSQIIDRRYGQSPNHSQETIYVAAVFDGSQRRIGAWAEVKQN